MTPVTSQVAPPTHPTTVVPTAIIHLSAQQAEDFANYLEAQHLADTVQEQRVLDVEALTHSPETGCSLDQERMGDACPDALLWLQEQWPHRCAGCRVERYEEAVMEDLLKDYQGSQWDRQGYAVIVASAIEIAIALELRGCPTLLQLELTDIPASSAKR